MESLGLQCRFGKDEEIFDFQTTELSRTSSAIFAEMRETGELCDFSIKAGSVQISAHRLVLAANIPYFRGLFDSNMKESLIRETTMEGVDPQTLKTVIDFIYTGHLRISENNVITLLNVAQYLQIAVLTEACLDFMSKRMDPEKALKVRICAEFADNEKAFESADHFIEENFAKVSQSDDFLCLSFDTLREIIRKDNLYVANEEVVFEAVIKWVKASKEKRIGHLAELMGDVRLELLCTDYLISRVSSDELVCSSPLCKKIVDDIVNSGSSKNVMTTTYEISSQERCCRGKHHLKCAEQMGIGMYSVSHIDSSVIVNYYDLINRKWTSLCNFDNMNPYYFASIGHNLYFIEFSSMHILNLHTMKCLFLGFSNTITEARITLHGEKIYFLGGAHINIRKIQCFDTSSLTFSTCGFMREDRQLPGAASLGENIYITGGEIWTSLEILNTAETYNPNTGESSEISPMLERRSKHSSAALNGKIYVCGGWVPRTFRRRDTRTCEAFDPFTNQWTLVQNMNTVKFWMSSFVLDNKLYVFDYGHERHDQIDHEIYDPSTDEWVRGDRINFPAHCTTAKVVVSNSAVKL